MQVRTKWVKSRGKHYRYAQVVESYRNAQGTPTHRVLASFSGLSDLEIQNLKAAVDASRHGKAVVLKEQVSEALAGRPILANLQYLDAAVALSMWREYRLADMLRQLVKRSKGDVPFEDVVAALTVHRCISPSSKLAAKRWFPKTALPELLGVSCAKFNNSRIHRVLGQLEEVEADLQESLSQRVHSRVGAFVALFLDITDTWFEGRGPALAMEARTKEGLVRRKIGLALMCDHRGLPLRWRTLEGKYVERNAMMSIIQEVKGIGWAQDAVVVVDRAMGRAQAIRFLVESQLRFLTAVTADEYSSYQLELPYAEFQKVTLAQTEADKKTDLKRLHRAAARTSMDRVSPTRYVIDLGVVERPMEEAAADKMQRLPGSRTRDAMELALKLEAGLKEGQTMRHFAKDNQCGIVTLRKHRKLLGLAQPLRDRILAGELDGATLEELYRVVALPQNQHAEAFDTLQAQAASRPRKHSFSSKRNSHVQPPTPSIQVRAVAAFKPDSHLVQRRKANERRREFEAFVDDLNQRLCSPNSRRSPDSISGAVASQLRRRGLTSVYDFAVAEHVVNGKERHKVEVTFKEKEWAERRRYDGFVLLVAEPTSPLTGPELVDLYFAKDKVEKDFQTIKSELELRPVHHRTDPKVRAHATLCVLALLLERTLEEKLAGGSLPLSAPRALETLRTCRLNHLDQTWGQAYSLTRTTDEQKQILRALDLMELDDDSAVREALTPR